MHFIIRGAFNKRGKGLIEMLEIRAISIISITSIVRVAERIEKN